MSDSLTKPQMQCSMPEQRGSLSLVSLLAIVVAACAPPISPHLSQQQQRLRATHDDVETQSTEEDVRRE